MTRNRDVATQGGLVLLNTQTVSASAGVSFSNFFTSSYTHYRLVVNAYAAATGAYYVRMLARMDNTDYTGSTYYSIGFLRTTGATTSTSFGGNPDNINAIMRLESIANNPAGLAMLDIYPSGTNMTWTGTGFENANVGVNLIGGKVVASGNITGLTIAPTGSTITGTISLYGYKK